MKKLIVFALLWVLALAIPISLMTQTVAPLATTFNPESYFTTLGAFAAIILPVTAFINRIFDIHIKWLKQMMSWIVALGVGILAWLFQWGIFIGIPWYYSVLYCFAAGLVANGIFNIEMVKAALIFLKLEPKKI